MVSSLFQTFKANDPYEFLISQIISVESQPQYDMMANQSTQKRQKTALGDLDSKISAFHTALTALTDPFTSPFDARKANVSDITAFNVSADDNAADGSHSLQVLRLSSSDTRISQQYSKSGSALRSFFDTNGAQSFTLNIGSPTKDDENNRVDISISIDPAGTTDAEILAEISAAVNTAMADAVNAETLGRDYKALASVVNETTDTARLSLRSGETGYANRLQFTDSANGLLALLDVTNAAIASGTGGGMIKDVGTSETTSELNSKFILDGLTLYRGSNQVSDALTGLTIDLKSINEKAEEFSVGPDTGVMKAKLEDFISKYNDIISFVKDQTMVDSDLDIRGLFAGDTTLRSLRFGMRNDISTQVTGLPSGALTLLTQIGIKIEDDGTLKLDDADALTEAIENNQEAIETLFTGEDGFANRLKNRLDSFLGAEGILDNRVDSLEEGITRWDRRIKDFEARMVQRENQLRQQYAVMQQTISLYQGQQSMLSGFFGGF